jgi:ParB/RepB/Spo0J family partition protein
MKRKEASAGNGQRILLLDPFRIRPFKDQPRKRFRGIAKLAESIRLVGQVTPILVTPCHENGFDAELVDGERRLQACRAANLRVKAVTQDDTEGADRFALSIASNFCRQGHDAMEIAEAIRVLRTAGRSAEEIAGIFGKSTPWVYQHAALLELCPEVQAMLARAASDQTRAQIRRPGRLTLNLALLLKPLGHARQATVARQIVNKKLSFTAARNYINVALSRTGHAKRQYSVAPANHLEKFWNATVQYRGATEGIAGMKFAALAGLVESLRVNRAKVMAEQLQDLRDNLAGIAAALKKRGSQ